MTQAAKLLEPWRVALNLFGVMHFVLYMSHLYIYALMPSQSIEMQRLSLLA